MGLSVISLLLFIVQDLVFDFETRLASKALNLMGKSSVHHLESHGTKTLRSNHRHQNFTHLVFIDYGPYDERLSSAAKRKQARRSFPIRKLRTGELK